MVAAKANVETAKQLFEKAQQRVEKAEQGVTVAKERMAQVSPAPVMAVPPVEPPPLEQPKEVTPLPEKTTVPPTIPSDKASQVSPLFEAPQLIEPPPTTEAFDAFPETSLELEEEDIPPEPAWRKIPECSEVAIGPKRRCASP